MYCEDCSTLFEDDATMCPKCASRSIRAVRADDLCYFIEMDAMLGAILADVFTQNDIRFYYKEALGAGFTMWAGNYHERYRFFVRYDQLEAAQSIYADLFPNEP